MAEAFNPELHEAISLREDDEAVFDVSTLCTVPCTFRILSAYPTCFAMFCILLLLLFLYLVMESIYKNLCYWI